MKSERNKTIDFTLEEGAAYLERCTEIKERTDLEKVIDKTLIGDAFDVMGQIPAGCADLIIADPPYNLDKDYNGRRFRKTTDEAYAGYTEDWLLLAKSLLKKSGTIYVCCDWQTSQLVGAVLKKHFRIQNRITWQREKGRGARRNWKNSMEDIWFATVSDDYVFNIEDVKVRRRVIAPYKSEGRPKDWEETAEGKFRNTYPSNFWDDITVPYWSMAENTAHPTQKPEKLLAKLILASSKEGDLVLDPFAGSGSTAVTAKKLGRHYIGIEREKQYCIWAEKRLEMADADKSIQGYEDGVFWERNSARAKTQP